MRQIIPDRFVEVLCESVGSIRTLFLVTFAMFGLMVIWFPFTRPGSATRVIVVINIVGSLGFVSVSGYFLRRCLKLEENRREREANLDAQRRRGEIEVGPARTDDADEDRD